MTPVATPNMSLTLPNTIIIGGPKCGSSSLYWWLASHPDACASTKKETHFFSDKITDRYNSAANAQNHGVETYSTLFDQYKGEKILFEATPIYLYQETALAGFTDWEQKPKFIAILRDPAKRAYSQFVFNKYRLGNIPEKMTFPEYMESRKGTIDNALERGNYLKYLNRWEEQYGKENLLVIQAEQLFKNKVETMQTLARQLGIDPSFYADYDFLHRNESKKMRSTKLHKLSHYIQPLIPRKLQEKVLLPLYLKINATDVPKQSETDAGLVKQYQQEFADLNQALAKAYPSIDPQLWT